MCIAILNTKKAGRLPKSQIKNSWDNNDMGAGLLWSENNKLNVFKTYIYGDYIEKYNELRDNNSIGHIVLHFRIATSGYNGEHNLHPFLVNDNLGFVHNGVIYGLGNKDFSDTYQFNDMLKGFKHDFTNCKMTKYFISEYIGNSKLIFLNIDDKYTIINEHLGKWTDDNWYSNDSYKQYNDYSWHGNNKVSKSLKAPVTAPAKSTNKKSKGYVDKDTVDYYASGKDIDSGFNYDDEWAMYDRICDIYGLDPTDELTWNDIEYYMFLNDCDNITEFYKTLMEYDDK
jgi:hypothetical protein